ncbi:hypothetical protein Vretimale_7265, partial [Volvox reticuliferus]
EAFTCTPASLLNLKSTNIMAQRPLLPAHRGSIPVPEVRAINDQSDTTKMLAFNVAAGDLSNDQTADAIIESTELQLLLKGSSLKERRYAFAEYIWAIKVLRQTSFS